MKVPILVYENEQAANQYRNNLMQAAESCNEFIELFNELPLKKIDSTKELSKVFLNNSIDALIVDMLPETPSIFGVKLKPSKVIDMMGLDLHKVKEARSRIADNYAVDFSGIAKRSGNKFVIDPVKLEQVIHQRFRYYAKTNAEAEIFQAIDGIQKNFVKLEKYGMRWDKVSTLLKYNPYYRDTPPSINTDTFHRLCDEAARQGIE
ncbi:MAG: hypothetical protein Q8S18_00045 [Bacteroidales bacterium]|nr:hypothetical protein [Bacteroidales bacterium]